MFGSARGQWSALNLISLLVWADRSADYYPGVGREDAVAWRLILPIAVEY